jgi:serine/threonine-protein kinase RsbW
VDKHRGIELDVPARPEYLSLVRQVVAAAAGVQPLRDDRIEGLRLAVSEATTNAIESYTNPPDGDAVGPKRVVIRCNLDHDQIEVEVSDFGGGGFEPAVTPFPSPDDPNRLDQEGGLGLPLMRHFADESEIIVGESGTSVRLVVYTPWRTSNDDDAS